MPGLTTSPAIAAGQCVLTQEQVEGPYYIAGEPIRRDVTEGRPGTPLELRLSVEDAGSCEPIEGATVEIWHADAHGDYSGFNGQANDTFMRGQQTTDANGKAKFTTVYPGWYSGRTTHIHLKVHVEGATVHTGQLYFDDDVTDRVYGKAPYAGQGQRDQTNGTDNLYDADSELALVKLKHHKGYRGRITLVVS